MKKSFYTNAYLYLAFGFIVTLIGFFPTYFKRLNETDALHHFHGITGSLWMIVLIVQPVIYRFGNIKYHRIIGWISVGFAPIVFYGAIRMIQFMMQTREPSVLLYKFAFLDIFTILPFALFVILGVIYRKKIHYHARFMICTIFGPLSAGAVRIFYLYLTSNNWDQAITGTYVLFEMVLVLLILDDYRSGKVRAPYVICFVIFMVQHVAIYYAGEWEWWRELTIRLTELPL